MPTGQKTAIYLRVSSKSQTTASQEPELKRWAAAEQAAGGVVDWYRDKFTGKTMDRPGWGKLWEGILHGDYSRLVIWRLDRLGRTAREVIPLLEDLPDRGVALVSLREGFDLSTPGGRLFTTMLAGFAQYETEVRSERQRAGITAARAKGLVYPGRKPGTLKGEPARAGELRAAGMKVREIAGALGVSPATVHRYLSALPGL